MTTTTARILSPLGSLAALSILERDDWNGGHLVIFDRPNWEHARQRPELTRPGVYVLIGGRTAYVGEGDPVLERLRSHNQNRDFWTRAIALTSLERQSNRAHAQFLTAHLCSTIAKAYTLENTVIPASPMLSKLDLVWATQALGVATDTMRLLGILFDTHPRLPGSPESAAARAAQAQSERPSSPGVLGRAILESAKLAYPSEVTTTELSQLLQLKFSLHFSAASERKSWLKNTLHPRLAALFRVGAIERLHDPLEATGLPGRWRWIPHTSAPSIE